MTQPRLAAQFFVQPDGVIIPKAPPMKRSLAKEIYLRDGRKCQMCGALVKFGGRDVSAFDEIKSGAIDHILPRARGGQNVPENLRLACITCNSQKGAK